MLESDQKLITTGKNVPEIFSMVIFFENCANQALGIAA
jgi:hypothetical protein